MAVIIASNPEVVKVTGFRVKLCTSIIRAVTKDMSSMRFWVIFFFIYPCDIYFILPQDKVVQGNMKAEAGRKEGRDQGGSEEAATARALLSSLCC